jgi:hypothetical protein
MACGRSGGTLLQRIAFKTLMAIAWLLCTFAASTILATAALVDETLLTPLPTGFKVGFSTEKGRMTMQEFVPAGETVDAWSSMVTVQVFHGMTNADPDGFAGALGERWKSACPDGSAQKLQSGVENKYPYSLWMFTCPLNPGTRQPENMWQKVIRGADSLYSVQYAYRREVTKELIVPAMEYLRKVAVCDNRHADRACPRGM